MSVDFHFVCSNCSKEYPSHEVLYLCPACSKGNTINEPPLGVLQIMYDYERIHNNKNFSTLCQNKFIDILPINHATSLPFLQVGNTPVYRISELNSHKINFNLLLKDDSQNPTFSFKDRASALVSAYAKENNISVIVAASTGNAGSSIAGICAAQKQKAVIFVPATAPKAKLIQIMMYGATIVPVEGTYDKAFDLSIEATKRFGWYNRNTAFNPLTIEGKKTVSFELFAQLNEQIPDKIFVPVGDGVILSGVYKGFEDLLHLGIINKMPVIVAVQAEGSSNLIRNLNTDVFKYTPSDTTADSISVDIPRNFYMAKKYLKTFSGEACIVSDEDILNASSVLSRNTGLFAEPAACAGFAGLLKFNDEARINNKENVVVLLTGSGLKDLNSVGKIREIPKPVKPDIESITAFLQSHNTHHLKLS